jgi:hypothetical protein
MRVEIRTRGGMSRSTREGVKPKAVWRGELAAIPGVGDMVVVRDGWAAEHVYSVFHEVHADRVIVVLDAVDEAGEYPEVAP